MRVSLAYNEDHWHKGVHRRICYSICLWDEKRQKKTTGAHSILIDTFGYLRQYFSRMIDSFWVLLVSKSMACWLIQYWVGKTGSESRRLYIDSLDVYTTRGSYLNRNRQDIRIIVISLDSIIVVYSMPTLGGWLLQADAQASFLQSQDATVDTVPQPSKTLSFEK